MACSVKVNSGDRRVTPRYTERAEVYNLLRETFV
jgi:hypothetical protein